MTVIAYACIDPYFESPPTPESWGQPIIRLYLDQGHPVNHRRQLQQLLQDCSVSPPDVILVRRLLDMGDSITTVMTCVESLEAQGVTILTLDNSYQTPTSATASLERSTLAHLATEFYTQHRSHRLQIGHAHNRVNGLPPPGRAPYGYRRGRDRYSLDRTTAPAIKAFFEQFLLYGSIRGAVRHLEKTYGKRISASTGQRWLNHPVYRGDLVYKDGRIIRDTHTPIINREEAAQIDRLLRRNQRFPPKTASAPRSLAGLVQCQECQSPLKVARVTRPRQSQEYLYPRPTHCGRSANPCSAIPYNEILSKTIECVCQELPSAISTLKGAPISTLKAGLTTQIDQKEAALEKIPALLSQGILDEATANLRIYTLRGELSNLQQEVAQLPPQDLLQVVQTLSIPQFWQDLSEAERRVYLREFIHEIILIRTDNTWEVQIRFVF